MSSTWVTQWQAWAARTKCVVWQTAFLTLSTKKCLKKVDNDSVGTWPGRLASLYILGNWSVWTSKETIMSNMLPGPWHVGKLLPHINGGIVKLCIFFLCFLSFFIFLFLFFVKVHFWHNWIDSLVWGCGVKWHWNRIENWEKKKDKVKLRRKTHLQRVLWE